MEADKKSHKSARQTPETMRGTTAASIVPLRRSRPSSRRRFHFRLPWSELIDARPRRSLILSACRSRDRAAGASKRGSSRGPREGLLSSPPAYSERRSRIAIRGICRCLRRDGKRRRPSSPSPSSSSLEWQRRRMPEGGGAAAVFFSRRRPQHHRLSKTEHARSCAERQPSESQLADLSSASPEHSTPTNCCSCSR
ncbi:hypothetical protein BJY59DRAFT_479997 [Rhodotorula toruloides]